MAVIVPEGCRHVGWLCEHALANPDDKWSLERTPHRQPNYGRARSKAARERGYDISTNTISAYTYRHDGVYKESDCPERKPVFVYEGVTDGS